MFCMFPSLRTVYFLELQVLNVTVENDYVLSEVRSKFFYTLNGSLFPRVGLYLIILLLIVHLNENPLCPYISRLSIFNQVSWPCLFTATYT
jgi:hypothetical protein